jgi:hypothetical protein
LPEVVHLQTGRSNLIPFKADFNAIWNFGRPGELDFED